jgi:hypothetical protein
MEVDVAGLLVTYRLFLSHSFALPGGADALSRSRRPSRKRPRPDDLRVLYDKEQIATGDDWRNRIAFMLHACHGGVVILDEAALESDWVPAEATFLSLRYEHDPTFGFLPVSFLSEEELSGARTIRTELANPTTREQPHDLPRRGNDRSDRSSGSSSLCRNATRQSGGLY